MLSNTKFIDQNIRNNECLRFGLVSRLPLRRFSVDLNLFTHVTYLPSSKCLSVMAEPKANSMIANTRLYDATALKKEI